MGGTNGENYSGRWDGGILGMVLNTALETTSCFALCYLAASLLATPHLATNVQPLGLVHLSPNEHSHSFLPLSMWFSCAGIPAPLFSIRGTSTHPSGLRPNVTSSGKPFPLLREDESFPP